MKRTRMSKTAARKTVRRAVDNQLALVSQKGYHWFVYDLRPAVKTLASPQPAPADRGIVAGAYCLLGDVYDVYFGAPRAALRAYRACVRLAPDRADVWQEIGAILSDMGDYRPARSALLRACRLNPDEELLQHDLQLVNEEIARPSAPLYKAGDPAWEGAELLARQRPRKALESLKYRRSIPARQVRARARAALGDGQGFVGEWTSIGKCKGEVTIGFPDWFMCPQTAWDSPAFWLAMLRIGSRFTDFSALLCHRSLRKTYQASGPPAELDHAGAITNFRLTARFHLARTQRDTNALRALCRKFPHWTEAASLLRRLSNTRR